MKVTLTIEDTENGSFTIAADFDPPLEMNTKQTQACKFVVSLLDSLKSKASKIETREDSLE